jgi:ABC-type transporter Mla maintaining outer membrane lipid asymmetry ATPase subunit MlaF
MVVTHKVTDALKIAERFIFLKDGNIQFDGNRKELLGTVDPDIQRFLSELRPGTEVQGL